MFHHTKSYHTISYHTITYHTIPSLENSPHRVKCHKMTMIYPHTIPYHTIPYHTIPYHTIPYHTIPYHTIPSHTVSTVQQSTVQHPNSETTMKDYMSIEHFVVCSLTKTSTKMFLFSGEPQFSMAACALLEQLTQNVILTARITGYTGDCPNLELYVPDQWTGQVHFHCNIQFYDRTSFNIDTRVDTRGRGERIPFSATHVGK